jgi:hypothetical protein
MRGLRADTPRFHRLIEMVAPDTPFLADLVGLKLAPQNPVPDGAFLDVPASLMPTGRRVR